MEDFAAAAVKNAIKIMLQFASYAPLGKSDLRIEKREHQALEKMLLRVFGKLVQDVACCCMYHYLYYSQKLVQEKRKARIRGMEVWWRFGK